MASSSERRTVVHVVRKYDGDGSSEIWGVFTDREEADRQAAQFTFSERAVDSHMLDQPGWAGVDG